MRWCNNSSKNKCLAFVSIAMVAVSIFCLIKGIRKPNYGGDELWFATPLLFTNVWGLNAFQFVYAGPLKTIVTAPFFHLFGFNIYSVRLFTIGVYLLGLLVWSLYLAKKNYWIALSATLIAASVNHDLLYYAKVDMNQPTFHNAVTICFFVLFIGILESGTKWWRSLLFIGLAVIEMNNHIRNVWIINAFLIAVLIDFYVISGRSGSPVRNLRALMIDKWPVFVGWLFSATYFFYILRHFAGNPGLEMPKTQGSYVSWLERLLVATRSFAEYSIGGKVFAYAYAGERWGILVIAAGGIFVISSAVLFRASLLKRGGDQWLRRLLLATFSIVILIFLQYAVTKSAIFPYHGNSLMLFITIFFGLLVQSLVAIDQKKLLAIYIICTITVMATVNIAASIQINFAHPASRYKGFDLAVWDLQALDDIRQYITDNPNEYYVADWGIGRPLALESKYAPANGIRVTTLEWRPLTTQLVSELNGAHIIRSAEVGRTVPDYSDEAISKIDSGLDFVVLKSFYDVYGREVYQLGFLKKRK
jgi:hypothetical protein